MKTVKLPYYDGRPVYLNVAHIESVFPPLGPVIGGYRSVVYMTSGEKWQIQEDCDYVLNAIRCVCT